MRDSMTMFVDFLSGNHRCRFWVPCCPDGTRYHDDSTHHYQNHELVMSFILQPLQCIAGYVLKNIDIWINWVIKQTFTVTTCCTHYCKYPDCCFITKISRLCPFMVGIWNLEPWSHAVQYSIKSWWTTETVNYCNLTQNPFHAQINTHSSDVSVKLL